MLQLRYKTHANLKRISHHDEAVRPYINMKKKKIEAFEAGAMTATEDFPEGGELLSGPAENAGNNSEGKKKGTESTF